MTKRKINWALSLQIGYLVYQYTKLRILQFYYDFLDKFVSREDFQLLEMDTDSLYMARSHERFEDVVRPHLREQFYIEYSQWFPGQACDEHHTDFQNDTFSQATMGSCSFGTNIDFKTERKNHVYLHTIQKITCIFFYIK